MSLTSRAHRSRGAAALAVVALLFAGCDAGSSDASEAADATDTASGSPSAEAQPAEVSVNVARGAADVPVSTVVKVDASNGRLTKVKVTSAEGELPGKISDDGARWAAEDRLEPGVDYTVEAVAASTSGERTRRTSSFTTQALTLDQQTYPSVAPLDGETVGVGMPVIVSFDVAVSDRAAMEKNMTVTSTPAQAGTWHWISDNEVHWRPKKYWQAGTEVHVEADVNGVDAGGGIYGQEDRVVDFTIGDAHIYKVNAQTHQMKVYSNGKLVNTFPITTGKEGFTTRSGTKVIMEKFDSKRMNSETVGIPQGSSESYDIDNVQWAMRLTSSGEFIHAAPWSVGSQGYANVSHGCTGMSTADAGWLYSMSVRGDVVEYTGTDRPMEPENGYGDWNIGYADYKAGSAL
ncbi:L,D-transpeptidase [Nocardioides sambongensis]|uniref:L,D-transpeptidase n=1 Tax=Nocardioides sambongensis TaxID=2589074 RepID=UPI001E3DAD9C|nr:Ig-like domain-containing protein [Nocardioides sambongensis]